MTVTGLLKFLGFGGPTPNVKPPMFHVSCDKLSISEAVGGGGGVLKTSPKSEIMKNVVL